MPSTYRFQEALNGALDVVPKGIGTGRESLACNMALNAIWMAFDWRQSLGELPPFYLIPNVQDYGAPWVSVPADFAGLRRAYHWVLNGDASRPTEMSCVNDQAAAAPGVAASWGQKEFISYYEPTRKFRILPVPSGNMGAPYHIIDGTYKRVPRVQLAGDSTYVTKITAANIANAVVPFDDAYIHVMVEAMKWALMVLSNNPGAGPTQIQGTSKSHGGQRAVMDAAIMDMARKERMNLGEKQTFPQRALQSRGYSSW